MRIVVLVYDFIYYLQKFSALNFLSKPPNGDDF